MKLEIVTESRLTENHDLKELLTENMVQILEALRKAEPTMVSAGGPVYGEDGSKVGNWRYYA